MELAVFIHSQALSATAALQRAIDPSEGEEGDDFERNRQTPTDEICKWCF